MASIISTTPWTDIGLLQPTPEGRVRFSRDTYHRMFETGVLDSERRFELLDGEIVMMSPIGPNQSNVTSRLNEIFVMQSPKEMQCRVQQPIVVSDHSEPEPDIAIVRRREGGYPTQHPGPADVVLLIEVAQSSLNIDLGLKLRLYAMSGIVEYWVVDLVNQIVIVHRDPTPAGYRSVQEFGADTTIAPLAAPDCRLDLGRLFR